MYSISTRFNTLFYNMVYCVLAMGALNYLDGFFGSHSIKDLHFSVSKWDMFTQDPYYDEEVAVFQFNLKADLSGLFNWNTNLIFASLVCRYETEDSKLNQVTIWDQRILRTMTEHYTLDLQDEWVEYYLTDVKKSLRGKEVTVSLRWEQMTTIGPYYSGEQQITTFTMPTDYVDASRRRKHLPGPHNRKENY